MSASISSNTTTIMFGNAEDREICAAIPSDKVFAFLVLIMDSGNVTVNTLAKCGAQEVYYADEYME